MRNKKCRKNPQCIVEMAYPEVVECSVGESLSCDIFRQRLDHAWLLHSQDGPWYEFSVISNGKMPRSNPHHVIKGEFDDESSLSVHLLVFGKKKRRKKGQDLEFGRCGQHC